ncbi:MAG: dienelactone hydrolase family protein [Spirochaetaceae bacterium]|nr:MAG: dienelactone hydrolase family protein [Spirochaetaceae bacterium]
MRIVLGVVIVGVSFAAIVAVSIVIDAAIGGGRVEELTNTDISIAGANGAVIRGYVAVPDGPGPHPAVIMVHEFFGLRRSIIEKADLLASDGYVVIAPDLYRGASTGWIPRAIVLSATVDRNRVITDLDAAFAWLRDRDDVARDSIGLVGFCFGGRHGMRYALENPDLAAVAVFYGAVPQSVEELGSFETPVLGVFGRRDRSIPLDGVERFASALSEIGVSHRVTIYDDVGHAFVTGAEAIAAGGAAGAAWNELRVFFGEKLSGSPATVR